MIEIDWIFPRISNFLRAFSVTSSKMPAFRFDGYSSSNSSSGNQYIIPRLQVYGVRIRFWAPLISDLFSHYSSKLMAEWWVRDTETKRTNR